MDCRPDHRVDQTLIRWRAEPTRLFDQGRLSQFKIQKIIVEKIERKEYAFFKGLILSVLLFMVTQSVLGQQAIVRVLDQRTRKPVPDARICLESGNTRIYAVTSEQGEFKNKIAGKSKITITCIGYKTFTDSTGKNGPGVILLKPEQMTIGQVVVTGQYKPQSVENSVFRVRTIPLEKIKAKGATDVLEALNTEAGIRFSNDLATGETAIQLMGMSGQRVKILLDGIPLTDRGSTRQSLSQIDLASVERIELVEGPMSVIYGTDALAGVVNIITKNAGIKAVNCLSVTARVQEETVGNEYHFGNDQGKHNENVSLTYWSKKGWTVSGGLTRNNFGGWKGSYTGRANEWMPKDQWVSNAVAGYHNDKFDIRYRLDYLDEKIHSYGDVNSSTRVATDKNYLTDRFTHQLQSEWTISDKLNMNTALSWQDYKRRTQTYSINMDTGEEYLTTGDGEQDVSKFKTLFFRNTLFYQISSGITIQPGIEYKRDNSSGERIEGSPSISDYSLFVSSEMNIIPWLKLRPGLRFSINSTYDAPPVIPSLNSKFRVSHNTDLRLSYARGFRAPSLRELYFWFFDANHSIKGNEDLKAEHSNSFTGSFAWRLADSGPWTITTAVSGFYNHFNNLITTAVDQDNSEVYTYLNVDKYKTTGGSWEVRLKKGNFDLGARYDYIGTYDDFADDENYDQEDLPEFNWTRDISLDLGYYFPAISTGIQFYYKFKGKSFEYEETTNDDGETMLYKARTDQFNWADLSVSKQFKQCSFVAGVKNIFDITEVDNTSQSTGAHSSGGPVEVSYGRSYFIGLTIRLSHNL